MTSPATNGMVPLDEVRVGQTVRLAAVHAGHGLRQRLAAMGLLPNAAVTVMRNEGCGRIIVEVKNTRVALGRGMARRVFVKPQPPGDGPAETNASPRGACGDAVEPPACPHDAHDGTA